MEYVILQDKNCLFTIMNVDDVNCSYLAMFMMKINKEQTLCLNPIYYYIIMFIVNSILVHK